MVRTLLSILITVLLLYATVIAAGNGVEFPEHHEDGVMYLEKDRGDLTEFIYTDNAAIRAAKRGEPFPSGTVITLVEYYRENMALKRYVVMEKRTGWGSQINRDITNGDWKYQAFNPDGSVSTDESLDRCFSCHKSAEDDDYVFSIDAMRAYRGSSD